MLETRDERQQTGREYLRVSKDKSGRMASVDQQAKENASDAERERISLGEPYREARDVSASRYSKKVRQGFSELLADLAAGTFGADLLYLWESSRGSRRVGEWVTLIDLCEEQGVRIRVTTHGRTYDPRNGRDRRTLLEDAVDSEYESYKTSTRLRRQAADMAEEGRPTGRCPWGYLPVHDTRTGALITWEPDPDIAPYLRELYQRISAGHAMKRIEADWYARGIRNVSGTPFTQQNLRALAVRPVYGGLRVHHGQITKGTWEPAVDPGLWHTVHRILTDPSRRTNRTGRAQYALTTIIRCDGCSGPMVMRKTIKGEQRYRCRDCGRVSIGREPVDKIVIGVILAYLSREEVYQSLQAGGEDSPQLAKIRDDLAETRSELTDAENANPETVFEARQFAKLVDSLTAKVRDLEEQERELTTPASLRRLIEPGSDVAERWSQLPISAKREIARLLLSPEILGEVRVKPTCRNVKIDPSLRLRWCRSAA